MHRFSRTRHPGVLTPIAVLALAAAATVVRAQPPSAAIRTTSAGAPPAQRADPLDPLAPVPAVVYRSPLAGFRAHAEAPVGSWREANDTVARIGGWRTYAREARAAADSPAAATPAPAAPSGTVGGAPTDTRRPPGGTAPAPATPGGRP